MRGFPPLHLFIFILAFGLLAIPLARLTFARPAAISSQMAAVPAQDPDKLPTTVRVRMAHLPSALSIKLDGQELLPAASLKPQTPSLEFRVPIHISKEGIELFATATWPAGTPDTALTIELEPETKETKSQTQWSGGGALSAPYAYTW